MSYENINDQSKIERILSNINGHLDEDKYDKLIETPTTRIL